MEVDQGRENLFPLNIFSVLYLTSEVFRNGTIPVIKYEKEISVVMPSCSIVERRRADVVMTKKTPYVLEGKLNFHHASEGGLPTFIKVAFKVRNV